MVTLNRASRNAAQASQKNAASQDRTGHSSSAQVCTRIAGARPKEIRSASESSCRPNGEVAPISRATKPSAMSSTIDDGDERGGDREVAVEGQHDRGEPAHHVERGEGARGEQPGALALGQLAQRDDLAHRWATTSRQRSRMPPVGPCAAGAGQSSPGPGAAQRAMTVSPATTRSPVATSRSHSGGTKTSIREPNFIRPTRWPVRELVALGDPGDDPAGHQADDLAEVHPAQLVAHLPLDGDVAALVEVRALVLVRGQPLARAARRPRRPGRRRGSG